MTTNRRPAPPIPSAPETPPSQQPLAQGRTLSEVESPNVTAARAAWGKFKNLDAPRSTLDLESLHLTEDSLQFLMKKLDAYHRQQAILQQQHQDNDDDDDVDHDNDHAQQVYFENIIDDGGDTEDETDDETLMDDDHSSHGTTSSAGSSLSDDNDRFQHRRLGIERVQLLSCVLEQDGVSSLVQFLNALGPDLEELVVEDFDFGSLIMGGRRRVIASLLNELATVASLKRLSFRRVPMVGIGSCDVTSSVWARPTLQELHFDQCEFDYMSFRGLLRAIEYPQLVLGGGSSQDSTTPSVATAATAEPGLRHLSLVYCMSTEVQFHELVKAILASPTTKHTLKSLSIADDNATATCWTIANNPLRGPTSFPYMTRLLQECPQLEKLNLADCREVFEDVEPTSPFYLEFTQSLACNARLQALNLRASRITDALAEPLLHSLQTNKTLQTLNVDGAPTALHDSLLANLPHWQGLKTLGANVDLESRPIQKALRRNGTLNWIDLGHKRITTGDEITTILRRNYKLQTELPSLLKEEAIGPATWPHCAVRLQEGTGRDPSAIYALLLATSSSQVNTWRKMN
eukprot:CAMPEP_0168731618 /NCGR_PEP_ID=MMETSP0724-20121128/7354_1 /TAXON_ID=265536 /ORGANISM="Amphiprora sp., Strain CCMP467" /LENGTH=574 /DNA_ID=CAMNT_0008778623 /DNA_START=190 /DNA_END=1914 /DNA_ORIENTATION=-